MSASFAGRERSSGRDPAPQKGKPLCVGCSFSLRDVLVIHDRESSSSHYILWKHPIHGSGKMPQSTSPIGTDNQDGGYEYRRIHILGSRVNKGRRIGFGDVWGGFEGDREHHRAR
jgi:hypothetical protein